jgi:hypothetical protein
MALRGDRDGSAPNQAVSGHRGVLSEEQGGPAHRERGTCDLLDNLEAELQRAPATA